MTNNEETKLYNIRDILNDLYWKIDKAYMDLKKIDMYELNLTEGMDISKILNKMESINHDINVMTLKILKHIEHQ